MCSSGFIGVQEMVRDARTEILQASSLTRRAWAVRFWSLEAKAANLEAGLTERMAVLERRLQQIEKRLPLNPPAA